MKLLQEEFEGFRQMNLFCLMISICALTIVVITPASAQNMTVSNLGYGGVQDVLIYMPNGSLISQYNTSSALIPLPTADFQIVIKPEPANPLSSPGDFLQTAFAFVQTNVVPLIVLMFLIYLVVRRS